MDSKKVAILFLIKPDSYFRIENFFYCLNYVIKYFNFQVYVYYVSSNSYCFFKQFLPLDVKFTHFVDYDDIFHRSRYINTFLKSVNTKYAGVWDVDVLIKPSQIHQALKLLQTNEFVLPYSDYFLEISFVFRDFLFSCNDCDFQLLEKNSKIFKPLFEPNPVGGLFFVNINSYSKINFENELFYGWGHDDLVRLNKFKDSGLPFSRVLGPLFHLTHPKSLNSRFNSKLIEYVNDNGI